MLEWTPCRVVLLLLLGFSVTVSGAQRTFVSAGVGSDTNPCTRALPCRGFAAAIVQTDPGGEVVALDTGGYGPLTIDQSVALIAPAGVHAAITALAGNSAIEIDAGSADVIVLRGLYLNSIGGFIGIDFSNGKTLHVEHCVVSGFGLGIYGNAADANVHVIDTIVRENETGLRFIAAALIRASLDSVRVEANQFYGVEAGDNSLVTATRSLAVGNGTAAIYTSPLTGFFPSAVAGTLNVEGCTVTSSLFGVRTNGTARIRNSLITGNTTGVSTQAGGSSISFGNNGLHGNGTNGTFTSTVAQQ